MCIKSILYGFFVVILGTCVPQMVSAHALEPSLPPVKAKSFAVFLASYNTGNDRAVGGVAGTAFFVSPHRAITAYHVLQPKSFQPNAGYERVRVWLGHEGEKAIRVEAAYMTYHPESDLTIIDFGPHVVVPQRYVFATDKLTPVHKQVESEGFMANSIGPILEREGADLTIVQVPKLERLHLSGQILQQSEINLLSFDLNLRHANCVQLSYQPIHGFSGGPVLANGKVIGMNSFADTVSGKQTWALQFSSAMLD